MLGKVLEKKKYRWKSANVKGNSAGKRISKQENSVYKSFGIELDEQSFSFSLFEPISISLSMLLHTHHLCHSYIFLYNTPTIHTYLSLRVIARTT